MLTNVYTPHDFIQFLILWYLRTGPSKAEIFPLRYGVKKSDIQGKHISYDFYPLKFPRIKTLKEIEWKALYTVLSRKLIGAPTIA